MIVFWEEVVNIFVVMVGEMENGIQCLFVLDSEAEVQFVENGVQLEGYLFSLVQLDSILNMVFLLVDLIVYQVEWAEF